MKKYAKVILTLFLMCLIVIIALFLYVFITIQNIDHSQELNLDKLNAINSQIKVYDDSNNEFVTTSATGVSTISLDELPAYLPQAFISIEDKTFYQHKGINVKRIIKAGLNNILSGSAKEGASTITQQLIKNTHLSSEKTMERKIQEAYLAIKLEQQYDKDKILETYLNVIYFGNSAFGVENASKVFFNKSAKELTLAESATLAGIIKSPRTYSPISNPTNCVARRNLVLKNMLNDKVITQDEYNQALNETLNVKVTCDCNSTLNRRIIDEAMQILDLSEKDISTSGLKIYTNINKDLQTELSKHYSTSIDNTIIVLDNQNGEILAYLGDGTLKRQVGSTIKPILCYAPALEQGILSPATPIKDEETNFSGYIPKNANKKFIGWTNVRNSLAKSLNVPAVKALEYVGVDKAQNFASKLGLDFDSTDNHLATALGATKYGFSMETMADAYATFARGGDFCKSKFIKQIKDSKGNILYTQNKETQHAVTSETCYLINDILKDTITCGTAKKLSPLNIPISAKTGTVGASDGTNTDAWCIAYNPNYTVLTWFGNASGKENNLQSNQNGGTIATSQNAQVWNVLKQNYDCNANFKMPDNIVKSNLDALSLKEQRLELASPNTPECYIVQDIFNKKYLPKTTSSNFDVITSPILNLANNGQLVFSWEGLEYLEYELFMESNGKTNSVTLMSGKNETLKFTLNIPDTNCEFYLITRYKNSTNESQAVSNRVKFYTNNDQTNTSTIKSIAHKWIN